jgi:hypothetical protein
MIVVRRTEPGVYAEIPPDGTILDGEGAEHPWSWVREVSDDQLAAIGVYKVAQVDVPAGKIRTGYEIVDQNGVPVMVLQLVDAPPPPPPPRRSIRKLLVVDRVIAAGRDAEEVAYIDKLLGVFAQMPVEKLRFDAAVDLWADDQDVIGGLTAIGLDPEQILAPE